jgi:thiosulfate/3-mercaptopyruvate sulfurtransferase
MSRQDALVSADWAEQNLDAPDTVLVEVDEDTTTYDGGHIPGAVKQRAGHIPGAANIPWSRAPNEDGTFRTDDELRELYSGEGVAPDTTVITYCRIGERSSHTWFALHELLGYPEVKNYDGSWTEYGSLIGVPVVRGDGRGSVRA